MVRVARYVRLICDIYLENVKSIVEYFKVVKSVGFVANTNLNLLLETVSYDCSTPQCKVPCEQKRYVVIAGPVANYCSDMLCVVKRQLKEKHLDIV